MKNLLFIALFVMMTAGCGRSNHEKEDHDSESITLEYAAYSDYFELFVNAGAFIVNEPTLIQAHFSTLPDFKAADSMKVVLTVTVNGKSFQFIQEKPSKTGIYEFSITPEKEGKGSLQFEIIKDQLKDTLIVEGIQVFTSLEESHEAYEQAMKTATNSTVFTKEQSWKIEFSTAYPEYEKLGQIIKTAALVRSSQGNEMVVTSKVSGIVVLTTDLAEGTNVSTGQKIIFISGSSLADHSFSSRITGAQSHYEKAKADYERAQILSKDRIISERDLSAAKVQFDQARSDWDNLKANFTSEGQAINSPMSGYVKQILVRNGSYVEAGEPVAVISQNKTVTLTADVPQKYGHLLGSVQTANIRSTYNNITYPLENLNGRILSYGKSANEDNFRIPVTIQIDNKAGFIPGAFVEIYLKSMTGDRKLTIPNTSLIEEQGSFYVWVQITPERFEKREVTRGSTDGIKTEIISGITGNDRIVTKGALAVKLSQTTGTLDAHAGHVH